MEGHGFSRAARMPKDFGFSRCGPVTYATDEVAAGAGIASNLPTRADS